MSAMCKRILIIVLAVGLLSSVVCAQQSAPSSGSSPDTSKMNMSNMSGSDMHDMPGMGGDGSANAMQSMEGHHMDMGAHMKMTALRPVKPGDQEKANQVLQAARTAAEKYTDYTVALAEGFKIFMPDRPQKM